MGGLRQWCQNTFRRNKRVKFFDWRIFDLSKEQFPLVHSLLKRKTARSVRKIIKEEYSKVNPKYCREEFPSWCEETVDEHFWCHPENGELLKFSPKPGLQLQKLKLFKAVFYFSTKQFPRIHSILTQERVEEIIKAKILNVKDLQEV